MKKLIVIGIVLAMVMGLAGMASAGLTPDNTIKMGLKFANGTLSQGTLTVGTDVGKSDGFVSGEDTGFPSPTAGAGEIICNDLPPMGLVTDGRYNQNLKAPITTPGQCKVWSLKAYVNGGAASSNVKVFAWMTSTGKLESPDYKVQLFAGSWTADQILHGDAGTALWTAPVGTNGTSTQPQYTGTAFELGANQYAMYTMAISMNNVPEPGSMVAMLSGLVGLIGFGIRRRK